MTKSVLAIIGGGRWGLEILSVAASIPIPFDKIVIVSKANAKAVSSTVVEMNAHSQTPIEHLSTIGDLIDKYKVNSAIVVNSAAQHFETARFLIQQGIHVLIEKPIVMSLEQMQILIEYASRYEIVLVPGLSYFFCSYLKNFARIANMKGTPNEFYLCWSDVFNEVRNGKVKRHDLSINVIQDVMPHIWTILSVIFDHPNIDIQVCTQDHLSAALTLSIKNIKGRVLIQRHGVKRERFISMQFDSGPLILDFTREPGTILIDNTTLTGDPLWEQKPGPLSSLLNYFFSNTVNRNSKEIDLSRCLDSVRCTESAANFRCPNRAELVGIADNSVKY